jgi:hypothetical protein
MPKRSATTAPVGSPNNGKRICTGEVPADIQALVHCLDMEDHSRRRNVWFNLYDKIDHIGRVMGTKEGLLQLMYNYEQYQDYFDPDDYDYDDQHRIIKYVIRRFQARVRGAMARGRVIPAMLSADLTDLRQAVLFCANGYK